VACEIAPQGVTAARSDVAAGPIAAVASAAFAAGALAPGLKPGNLVDRLAIVTALRRALEEVGAKPNTRNADITLVLPDGACRVLLLDFEALPTKLSEALPLVRFRLKKLVPFDADTAMVSFQILSQSKHLVRVLAVSIPRDVLAEYESAVREAGFEPGAVLPSTLAAMGGVASEGSTLLVNANALGVTTAIARDGILLLHRAIDLQLEPAGVPAGVPVDLLQPSGTAEFQALPIVSREETEAEWAAQEPLPEHGRNPYAVEVPVMVAASSMEHFAEPGAGGELTHLVQEALAQPLPVQDVEPLPAGEFAREIAQAVSVAAAYFEDTLNATPDVVLSAGSVGQRALETILRDAGVLESDGLRVRELVTADALGVDATSARVSRSALASVWGALCG